MRVAYFLTMRGEVDLPNSEISSSHEDGEIV